MVGRVGAPLPEPPLAPHGLVVAARVRQAREAPAAQLRPVVGGLAVRAGHQRAGLGRHGDQLAESVGVAHRPGGQHQPERDHHGRQACRAARPRSPRDREREERQQRQRLAAGQRTQRHQRAQRRRPAPGRAVAHAVRDEQRPRQERGEQRLAEQRSVGSHEHRVERGQRGGRDTRALASDPPSQQAHQHDSCGPEGDAHRAVCHLAGGTDQRGQREHQRVQGGMAGAGDLPALDEGVEVPVSVRDAVGHVVEPDPVAGTHLVGVDQVHRERPQDPAQDGQGHHPAAEACGQPDHCRTGGLSRRSCASACALRARSNGLVALASSAHAGALSGSRPTTSSSTAADSR